MWVLEKAKNDSKERLPISDGMVPCSPCAGEIIKASVCQYEGCKILKMVQERHDLQKRSRNSLKS